MQQEKTKVNFENSKAESRQQTWAMFWATVSSVSLLILVNVLLKFPRGPVFDLRRCFGPMSIALIVSIFGAEQRIREPLTAFAVLTGPD